MAVNKILGDLLPTRVFIGLSSIIGITCLPGQQALTMQYLNGGTLEIVSPPASINWGQGFVVPSNAILTFDLSGVVWLASSGATTTVQVIRGRGQGFEGASMGFRGV